MYLPAVILKSTAPGGGRGVAPTPTGKMKRIIYFVFARTYYQKIHVPVEQYNYTVTCLVSAAVWHLCAPASIYTLDELQTCTCTCPP